MLIEFARNYEILGDAGKQRAKAEDAQRIMAALFASKTGDSEADRALAAAEDERGNVLRAQGNLPEALAAYRDSA